MYFLAVFAGFWAPRKKRLDLSKQFHINRDNFYRHYLQVHFRCFAAVKRLTKCGNTCGLRCVREQGQIMSTSHGGTSYYFEEQRISIFGLISEQDDPCEPIFYSVLVLNENAQIYPLDDLDWNCLDWRPGLEGPLTFQVAVLGSVDIWEAEWNKALDQIDDCLQVKMDQTLNPEKLKELMFDDNFGRSQQYFTILQTLRIFGEWVRTVSDDLRGLDDLFLKEGDFPLLFMSPEESQTLKSNWESVRKTQKRAEENLMSRILNKTEEVKSLRDGLFNASSLREARESAKIAKQSSELAKQSAEMTEISLRMANESSDMAKRSLIMGRYVLIFTVVTVLYLPPSFISTVFALNIFQKDPSQTKWEYKVTLVSVSLVTYAVAFVAVIAAKGGRKLIPGSTQEEPTPAAAGSAPEVRDEESGVPREKEHWHSHLPVGRLVRRVLRPKGPE
ncbi:hypothetical protein F4777DRAFT_516376 [Nemania sp. FL0916]|nr:hypothetical protein F4777DRAFT_516376 [Nemania sp. FL0916]